jgi:hypothetical protein
VKLQLDADARGVEPGAPVVAEVVSLNNRYQPEGGARLKLSLLALDGSAPPTIVEGETGEDGMFRAPLQPGGPGAYKVRAEVWRDGRSLGVDEDVFVVRATSLERLYGEPRPDLLAALAGAGGGRVVQPDGVTGLGFTDHGQVRVHRQKTEPVWDRAWVLAVIVALAAAEWWLRRRHGFA